MHHPVDEQPYDEAVHLLRQASRVAVLTGAGVSAESGIATFRGAGGLWEGHRIEEVATPQAFHHDPALVWRFYNLRRNSLRGVSPNAGHHALAQLEDRFGSDQFTLATQNIDGLHRAAGSRNVLELHGRLSRVRCTTCEYIADRPHEELPDLPTCPQCTRLIRPDIVWFGEMLPQDVWHQAQVDAERCNVFLVVGTSAVVYPAAGLVQHARAHGAAVIEVNLEATAASAVAGVRFQGKSGEVLPELLRRLGDASA